jgi:amino acid permease
MNLITSVLIYLFMKGLDGSCERFEMLMVVTAMKVAVVWDIIPCSVLMFQRIVLLPQIDLSC